MSIFKKPEPLKIFIIRHGEKPVAGDHLNCQGLNRALALPAVLYSRMKVADHIFVPALNEGKTTDNARMYETVVPYAVKYNIAVDTRFKAEDTTGIAGAALKETGNVLIVWSHKEIADIAKKIGIKEVSKWSDSDYDSIWIISFQNGVAVLSKEKQDLKPSSVCS